MFKLFKICLPAGRNKKEPESPKEILEHLKKLEKNQEDISRELEELKEKGKKDLQKVGIVRFNPFQQESGGDQSFSIALLDANDDGVVLTSHYLRESNRVYAKPVIQGQSEYQLSEEEKNAINKARTTK